MFKKLILSGFLLLASIATQANEAVLKLPKGVIPLTDKTAIPLRLNDIDGEQWDIINERGHWVFVHFWASWCGPCRKEMPTIQKIVSKLDQDKIVVYLINTAEDEDTVFEFLSTVAPDLNPLMDTDGLVTERWQPRGLPATYLVDPEGIPRYVALGGRPWDQAQYLDFLISLYQ